MQHLFNVYVLGVMMGVFLFFDFFHGWWARSIEHVTLDWWGDTFQHLSWWNFMLKYVALEKGMQIIMESQSACFQEGYIHYLTTGSYCPCPSSRNVKLYQFRSADSSSAWTERQLLRFGIVYVLWTWVPFLQVARGQIEPFYAFTT